MATERETGGVFGDVGREDLKGALLGALLVNVVGAVPAIIGGPQSDWFESLTKPALFPPTWAFGVAWTLLFTLMGVALYLVYRQGTGDRRVRIALGLFALQMAFNVAWTPTFFLFQNISGALVVIGILWVLLIPTLWAFDRVDRRAAVLLIPYFAWVSFATLLNYQFMAMN